MWPKKCGHFHGKDTITVKVIEVDGEKKLGFDSTSKEPPPPQPELVGAAAGEEAK